MRILSFLSFVLASLFCCSGCSQPNRLSPVVVHVFRDPSVKQIEIAIQSIGQKHLTTADEHPIVIATFEPKSYREGLNALGRQMHPDLVILNSPDDTKQIEAASLSAVRTATGQFFIGVPPWSEGEERKAATRVLSALRAALESNPK